MPGKKGAPAKTARQWRYFGYLAGKGVGWAKDKTRGRHPPGGSRKGGGKRKK